MGSMHASGPEQRFTCQHEKYRRYSWKKYRRYSCNSLTPCGMSGACIGACVCAPYGVRLRRATTPGVLGPQLHAEDGAQPLVCPSTPARGARHPERLVVVIDAEPCCAEVVTSRQDATLRAPGTPFEGATTSERKHERQRTPLPRSLPVQEPLKVPFQNVPASAVPRTPAPNKIGWQTARPAAAQVLTRGRLVREVLDPP